MEAYRHHEEAVVQVSVLLQTKGSDVVSVRTEVDVAEVIRVLAEHRIGAAVVTDDDRSIVGIISERDVVRVLAERGAEALGSSVQDVMERRVVTCELDTTVEELMSTMTERRIRHVPVLVDGALAGLVSIGDVVKDHIAVLEHEKQAMQDYIANPY